MIRCEGMLGEKKSFPYVGLSDGISVLFFCHPMRFFTKTSKKKYPKFICSLEEFVMENRQDNNEQVTGRMRTESTGETRAVQSKKNEKQSDS